MVSIIRGKITYVSRVGGLKLDENDTWYNPIDSIKSKITSKLEGVEVALYCDFDNKFKRITDKTTGKVIISEEATDSLGVNAAELQKEMTETEKKITPIISQEEAGYSKTEETKEVGFTDADKYVHDDKPRFNYFRENAAVKVKVEKKGRFNYCSWADGWDKLKHKVPMATNKVYENAEGLPFFKTEKGVFVKVSVTCYDLELIQWHPVLDNKNMVIQDPSLFQINTSIQRALAKAIALHGIGLYLYQGEDLPKVEEDGN